MEINLVPDETNYQNGELIDYTLSLLAFNDQIEIDGCYIELIIPFNYHHYVCFNDVIIKGYNIKIEPYRVIIKNINHFFNNYNLEFQLSFIIKNNDGLNKFQFHLTVQSKDHTQLSPNKTGIILS